VNGAARHVALAGALLALSAVVLAAMGSHLFDMNGLQGLWQTASVMHLFNAAGLIGLGAWLTRLDSFTLQCGAWSIVLGTVVFCGSIYLHVITGYTLPAVTPAGGLLLMAGWLLTAIALVPKA
jgi:uncharacterized membrane protein YgdD (TMEM256/DUF423 family)